MPGRSRRNARRGGRTMRFNSKIVRDSDFTQSKAGTDRWIAILPRRQVTLR